jgi:hypothetical protein
MAFSRGLFRELQNTQGAGFFKIPLRAPTNLAMKNVIARPVKQYVKGPSDCKQNNIVCFYFLEKSRIGIRFLFPALDNEVKK